MPGGGEDAQGRKSCPGEARQPRQGEDAQEKRGCSGEARLPRQPSQSPFMLVPPSK